MNGYAKRHAVEITARADMLETVAGYENSERVDREIAFATSALDLTDPESCRWLACLLARRIDELEAK